MSTDARLLWRWTMVMASVTLIGLAGEGCGRVGMGSSAAGGTAPAVASAPLRIVFHARAHSDDALNESNEIIRAMTDARSLLQHHPGSAVVLIVEKSNVLCEPSSKRWVLELQAAGAIIETTAPYIPPNRMDWKLPDGVRVLPDLYERIDQLQRSGWTYIAL